MIKSYVKLVLTAALAVLFLSTFATAQAPGAHPAYLHALSNLRYARAIIYAYHGNPEAEAEGRRAIVEIDAAIHEIVKASIDDGRPLSDHPPADATSFRAGPFTKAFELINDSIADINKHEQNDYADGLKQRALMHLNEAVRIVHHILYAPK
jgi:hypothetical protein